MQRSCDVLDKLMSVFSSDKIFVEKVVVFLSLRNIELEMQTFISPVAV